jgi:hypothetical protein
MPVDGIRRAGRATQGVIVMRPRGKERVSTLAPVIEQANGSEPDAEPVEADSAAAPAEEPASA